MSSFKRGQGQSYYYAQIQEGLLQCIFCFRYKANQISGKAKSKAQEKGIEAQGSKQTMEVVAQVEIHNFSQDSQIQLRIKKRMLHLEDLLSHHNEHSSDLLCESQHKPNYLPQLKEIKEIDQTHSSFDTFYHHLGEEKYQDDHLSMQKNGKNTELLSSSDELCSPFEEKSTKKKIVNKSRNQTKNIPKNFGKGIITFVEKNKQKFKPFIESYGFDCEEFIGYLRFHKSKINTIAQLRGLWTGEMGGCIRVLSNLFFRKYALEYIFNSRISSYGSHIKYRSSLWRALEQPESFNHIKQY